MAFSRASWGALQRLLLFVLQKPQTSILSRRSDTPELPAPLLVCESPVSAFAKVSQHGNDFSLYILKSLRLLCLHWPAGGDVFINFCCPLGLTPTPGPPLSAPDERTSCTNLPHSRGWAYVGDFTERVKESSQTHLLDYFFLQLPALWVWTRQKAESRHVYNLGSAVSSPGLSPFPSSPLPPSRLVGHGFLLWRGGDPKPLHAQVREHRLQSYCGGIERVRLPTWGILHADGVNALLPPVQHSGPGAEPQRPPPDRLPQERGEHLVAEPIHVFRHPAPEFCQPHPAPG